MLEDRIESGKPSHVFRFAGYRRDPLAVLIIDRLRWTQPWKFSSAYVTFYLASTGVAFLVYMVRDGVIDVAPFGGYDSLIVDLLYILVVGGFVSGFYVYVSCKIGVLYDELATAKVIAPDNAKVRDLVIGEGNSIQRVHHSPLWTLLALIITIVVALGSIYGFTWDPATDDSTRYRSTAQLVGLPVAMIGWYMALMIALKGLVSIRGLYQVFHLGQLNLHPLHPDKCGGLRPLNNYALNLAYLVAVCGFGLALVAYNSAQQDRLAGDFLLWVAIGGYIILAPIVFFGTLGAAHGAMENVKFQQLQSLSARFNEDYRLIHEQLENETTDVEKHLERLQQIHAIYRITESFPVWPFDWGSIRRFVGAVSSPLVPVVITVLKEVLQ